MQTSNSLGLGTSSGSPSFMPVLASGPSHAVPVATSSTFTPWTPHGQHQQLQQGQSQQQQHQQYQRPLHRRLSSSFSSYQNQQQPQQPSAADGNGYMNGGSSSLGSAGPSNAELPNTNAMVPYSNGNGNGSNGNGSGSQVTAMVAGQPLGLKSTKRAIQSCAECKRRKIKCDRVYPCSPCKLRGEENLCKEVEKVEPIQMPVPTMMDFEAACNRISQLEEMMSTLQRVVALQSSRQQSSSLQQITAAGEEKGSFRGIRSENISRANSPATYEDRKMAAPPLRNYEDTTRSAKSGERDHEDMAMMLEDFAMNNRANRDRAARLMGAPGATTEASPVSPQRGNSSIGQTTGLAGISAAVNYAMAAGTGFKDPLGSLLSVSGAELNQQIPLNEPSHPVAGIYNPEIDYLAKFFAQAPDAVRGWQLVQFYFNHLEWYSRVLHAPTFLNECKNLLSLPISAVSVRVRPAFLATYFMVLCLALQFIEEQDRINLGLSAEEAHLYCTNMFSAVQGLLLLCDFLGHHTLEHLQIIALMGVYQYNVGQADSHWALLGSAIKIAQNIGMSRLGVERPGAKWPENWQDPLKREIGRRVWWNFIFLDWSHATAHNATYTIHPSQNFTGFPANVDDDDLQDNKPFTAKPMEQHTDTSFTICRLRFVALYRELVDHNPPSYSFILEMDTKIVNLLDSLPPYFRGATPPSDHINDTKVMECLLIQLIGETRLLRLHRPYLSRGYRDRKYAPSKERCVNSARSILVLLKTAEKASPILLGQWLTLFYGFGAAVVTFIDLCHGKSTDNEASSQQKRQHVSEMINLLKSAKNVSDPARRATTLLEGLLAAEEDCPVLLTPGSQTGQKRKIESLDDSDPFKKVVKKLLLDASGKPTPGNLPSPSSSAGVANASPTFFGNQNSQDNRLLPSMSNAYMNQPLQPPPFQADLDLFMEGSRAFTQYSKHTPLFPGEEPMDATSADLSHLFVDDILSNLFTTDPLGGPDLIGIGGQEW